MIKLFASDLDGTLLPRSHQFDELIVASIEKIVASGYYFTIATGRDSAMTTLNGLENKIYQICLNGALIKSPQGTILKKELIDKDVLKLILEEFDDLNLELKMFMNNASKHLVFNQSTQEILEQDICKINTFLEPGQSYNRFYHFLDEHSDAIINAPCDDNMIEITKKSVNKGTAIHWLGQYLYIHDDEIAVYGDGGNDIKMLSMFQHSYAPSTALKEAQYAAHTQLGPYYEYSVARHMLETIAKQK
ncbi:HAD family hydrolase [uncultured Sharpea sp.]|uniref:HAD family hydrolase n=1 Tax=uncultured Sharpea sp. TaxID=1112738 RepID=UPI00258C2A94|nr:HAD-IIB family hydrolase [uncultured Sharpea sp.]